jgi:FAD/FMN-containing dehydrogenase
MRTISLDDALRGDMYQIDPILLTQLEAVLGKRNVATSLVDRRCFSHDIMPSTFKWVRRDDVPYLPQLVVFPGSVRDVQEIVKMANFFRVPSSRPVVPRVRSAG